MNIAFLSYGRLSVVFAGTSTIGLSTALLQIFSSGRFTETVVEVSLQIIIAGTSALIGLILALLGKKLDPTQKGVKMMTRINCFLLIISISILALAISDLSKVAEYTG